MESKTNWILLRGLVRGRGHWGSFVDVLKERRPDDQFEYLDLPGNGESNQLTSPLKIADYVKILRSQSQFVKEHKNFRLVGVSLGGMIATEWMRSFPLEVSKGFLVVTSASNFSVFYDRFKPINYLRAVKSLPLSASERERNILEMIANNPRRIEAELPALAAYSEAYPIAQTNFARQLWAAAHYQFPDQAPGDIKLIGTFGDNLVSPDCTLQIAKKWKLKAEMHPSAGHDISIDDPAWLVEQLL